MRAPFLALRAEPSHAARYASVRTMRPNAALRNRPGAEPFPAPPPADVSAPTPRGIRQGPGVTAGAVPPVQVLPEPLMAGELAHQLSRYTNTSEDSPVSVIRLFVKVSDIGQATIAGFPTSKI